MVFEEKLDAYVQTDAIVQDTRFAANTTLDHRQK